MRQLEQRPAPEVFLNMPALHLEHVDEPVFDWNRPEAQLEQEDEFWTAENWPAMQLAHEVAPLYWPAGQTTVAQELEPVTNV